MTNAQHNSPSRCRVLLHPTAMYNPDAIRAVQQSTGGLVVVNGGQARLSTHPSLPATDDFGPFTGGAA